MASPFGGRIVGGFRDLSLRAGKRVGTRAGHMAAGTLRGTGRAGGGILNAMAAHPKSTIAAAIGLGAGASLVDAAFSPEVQEQVFGDPDMVKIGRPGVGNMLKSSAQATFLEDYRASDMNNPYQALGRGGAVFQTPSYLHGRPVMGPALGDIAGSRVFGGFNISPTNRIRGSGSNNIADGSMVFGMWNARR